MLSNRGSWKSQWETEDWTVREGDGKSLGGGKEQASGSSSKKKSYWAPKEKQRRATIVRRKSARTVFGKKL